MKEREREIEEILLKEERTGNDFSFPFLVHYWEVPVAYGLEFQADLTVNQV